MVGCADFQMRIKELGGAFRSRGNNCINTLAKHNTLHGANIRRIRVTSAMTDEIISTRSTIRSTQFERSHCFQV